MPRNEILGWDHVSVKGQIFVVCILVASVSLVAQGLNCEVGVVDLVY